MSYNLPLDKEQLAKELFYSDLTKEQIQKQIPISFPTLVKVWENYFTPLQIKTRKSINYAKSKLGDKNPMYGKPTMRPVENVDDGNGYTIKNKPTWWTGREGSRYVFEHQLVMCGHLGLTAMPKDFVIHHINNDRKDNSLDNLAMMSKSAHGKLHQRENRIKKGQNE